MTDLRQPPCADDDAVQRAARSALYGAVLVVSRPGTRLKPAVAAAAAPLVPAVRAWLAGERSPLAEAALRYAEACGAAAYLQSRRGAPQSDG
jgi:hypothetical protein